LQLLYIEDNPVNVLLVEEMVALCAGVCVHSAINGQEGVAACQRLQPQVVLIDMQLPDFDGFEVLRRLRAAPGPVRPRCIALSANAMAEDVARARAAGFEDYWTKPIDIKQFMAALERLAVEFG
jgi:CheY-like chemotaxis protein